MIFLDTFKKGDTICAYYEHSPSITYKGFCLHTNLHAMMYKITKTRIKNKYDLLIGMNKMIQCTHRMVLFEKTLNFPL